MYYNVTGYDMTLITQGVYKVDDKDRAVRQKK